MMKQKGLTFKEKILAITKKEKKKGFHQAWIALLLCFLLISLIRWSEPEALEKNSKPVEHDTVFSASMVGDIMLGRHVEEITKRHGYASLFAYAENILSSSDYTTGNFEHPIIDNEDEFEKADKTIHLSSKQRSLGAFEQLNFSTVNLANNHMMDYKSEGFSATLDAFRQTSIDPAGVVENGNASESYTVNQYEGLDVATLGINDIVYSDMESTSPTTSGILTSDPDDFIPAIKKAKENADLVMVHLHSGQEYDSSPTTRQKELAHAIADAGADIIIGHHPHVLQSIDVYNDTLIMYSLGNFIFDQGWTRTRDSVIADYQLKEDGTAMLEMHPFRVFEAQPRPVQGLTKNIHKKRIFRQLTKDTEAKENIVENGERLIISADHSHVLKNKE
ncbi:CapA family protein [Alteribacillus bidgolensis]|uniref:Poly-gamma-glutamate synthesis protein (Capsule biosynthesis protein) n=1 Tax=Alteribacillus bidgolensis TaxID=930129 RepID=A0A1G8CFM1_9BACI|nr:CapA family protein [Alteribacillus bidgolensis]SDH44003.1 poly-gamma-glutamate synthesis protein (capsule biosynthesis protein) [Alteribacillus bidgolensis]